MDDPRASISVYSSDTKTNLSTIVQVVDMTQIAADAWVKVEEAKRDTVVVPSKQHTRRTLFVILAVVALPLESLLVQLPAVLASIAALAGVWATIEIIRAVKK